MRRTVVFVLALLMLTACSKQAPEVSANDQVPADQRTEAASTEGATEGGDGATFVAVDIAFESAPETLPAGENEIILQNTGSIVHDVTFEELGDQTVVVAQGGETATDTATLEPGAYTFYCSVPGHREAGMEGELTVE